MLRSWSSFGALLADGLASAVRSIRRHPGFAAGIILTLGLGVGANAAMFGILDRLLLRPPAHVRDHERVMRVMVVRMFGTSVGRGSGITFPDYQDFTRHSGFTAVAGFYGPYEQTAGRGADARRIRVSQASASFFPLLGVAPHIGRFYDATEDRMGGPPVVVLGYEYWRRELGGDEAALGRTLPIGREDYTIVGVAPPGFTGVNLSPVDVWLPLEISGGHMAGTEWRDSRGIYWLQAVARLAPGAAVEAAAAGATALHRAGRREQIDAGNYPADASIELDPLIRARGPQAPASVRVARWLGAVSLSVLLIVCANVANLLLASGTRRRREVAVRLALGVSRARLVGQMVLESVVLALAGGGVALLIAVGGGRFIRVVLLPDVAFADGALGARVVVFTMLVAGLAGVAAGLGPAIQGTRDTLAGDLAAGGRGSTRRSRTRALLTILQASLSVVLLVGAGLFVRSVANVRALDLGLDVDRLVMASLEFETALVPGSRVELNADPSAAGERNELFATAMRRVASLPGVESVAATDSPFESLLANILVVPGLDSIPRLPGGGPYFQDVTHSYMATVGLRVLRGRDLAETDDAGAPGVALVSETMARTLWPDVDPIGRTFSMGGTGRQPEQNPPLTVVGVVEDASRGELREDPYMVYYLPHAQRPTRLLRGFYLRTEPGRTAEVAAAAAPLLRSLDPRIRFADVQPLREILDPQARSWTLGATMFTIFGVLALIVAAVGLYSVLAFDVAQRTRELGIRTALGAAKGRLLVTVLREGFALAGLGVALGLAIAVAVAPYARDLLFEVSPRDPVVLAVVAIALVATGVLASLLPALRATRVDPVVALRAD
jgi:predicted permease